MANTKHSVAREIIIDRLLHKRRGYSIYEMLEIINESLEFEGFTPVSLNTIRRDLETIEIRYKQRLDKQKRSYHLYYRYADPNFTIYNNVLTFGEIQHLHSALLAIRFCDPLQGTLMYKEMSTRLSDMLDIDPASDPIVLYKHVPSMDDCRRFRTLYEYIRTKTPACITYNFENKQGQREAVIHPYYILNDDAKYYLLGHDEKTGSPIKISISKIINITPADDTEFIPNHDYPLQEFYLKHFTQG